jgi:hypothetical protein
MDFESKRKHFSIFLSFKIMDCWHFLYFLIYWIQIKCRFYFLISLFLKKIVPCRAQKILHCLFFHFLLITFIFYIKAAIFYLILIISLLFIYLIYIILFYSSNNILNHLYNFVLFIILILKISLNFVLNIIYIVYQSFIFLSYLKKSLFFQF